MAASFDELVARRARALAQHQRVMAEAAYIAQQAAQARRLRAAAPIVATPAAAPVDARQRVHWVRAS